MLRSLRECMSIRVCGFAVNHGKYAVQTQKERAVMSTWMSLSSSFVRAMSVTSAAVASSSSSSSTAWKAKTADLTPAQVVSVLDECIVGQHSAKRAVALALRTRWRRAQLECSRMREEVSPRNILMIGPTGCGKTEIARRLAKMCASPFVKVEATKFTEVGFHGTLLLSLSLSLSLSLFTSLFQTPLPFLLLPLQLHS